MLQIHITENQYFGDLMNIFYLSDLGKKLIFEVFVGIKDVDLYVVFGDSDIVGIYDAIVNEVYRVKPYSINIIDNTLVISSFIPKNEVYIIKEVCLYDSNNDIFVGRCVLDESVVKFDNSTLTANITMVIK